MASTILLIGEVIWGLILCKYYAFIGLLEWIVPDRFNKSVKGEIVLITGGGSGIGRIVANKFANLGATIVTLDVNEKGNQETVA